jgi:hypothetical protein
MQGCKLYLTYRTEYLILRDLCVGVRDRRTSVWLPLHAAVCSHVLGPVDSLAASPIVMAQARVGEQLCLHSPARQIVTGPIVAIEEPSARLMRQAERQWQELFQPGDPRHSGMTLVEREG